MSTDKIIVAVWLFVTSIGEEISMTNSIIHTKKTIVFVTAICVNDIDKIRIRFINSYFFPGKFKRRASWIESSDSVETYSGLHKLTDCTGPSLYFGWSRFLKLNSEFAYLAA